MPGIWRTVSLGLHDDGAAHRTALDKKGIVVSDCAAAVLGIPGLWKPQARCEISLVVRSLLDLGIEGEVEYSAVALRALELGLKPCPAEVGPALCLQYDQPEGEWLLIAMEPVFISQRDSRIFGIGHSHCHTERVNRMLVAGPTYKKWAPDRRFVFWVS